MASKRSLKGVPYLAGGGHIGSNSRPEDVGETVVRWAAKATVSFEELDMASNDMCFISKRHASRISSPAASALLVYLRHCRPQGLGG